MTTMTDNQFDFLCDLVRKDSAIVLERGKEYLVESRLAPIARSEGLTSVGDLVQRLLISQSAPLRTAVVDAMTTNETSFFRDIHPWQTLREQILPDLFKARAVTRRLNVWCAACSSGQEPYSLAMLLKDDFPTEWGSWDIRITATDLSETMVNRCREGRFSQLEVNRGLPATSLIKHFRQHKGDWHIDDSLRKVLDVRAANLVTPSSLPNMGGIDLLMIRNVLIYFDEATKAAILSDLRSRMRTDGYLMLGSSEVTAAASTGFTRSQTGRTIYFRPAT